MGLVVRAEGWESGLLGSIPDSVCEILSMVQYLFVPQFPPLQHGNSALYLAGVTGPFMSVKRPAHLR